MLQAEKRIRIRSLVEMNVNLKEIKEIFAEQTTANSLLVQKDVNSMMDVLQGFSFNKVLQDSEQAVIYFIAGYVSKNIIKRASDCQGCVRLASPGKIMMSSYYDEKREHDTEELHAKEDFLKSITPGGLL